MKCFVSIVIFEVIQEDRRVAHGFLMMEAMMKTFNEHSIVNGVFKCFFPVWSWAFSILRILVDELGVEDKLDSPM